MEFLNYLFLSSLALSSIFAAAALQGLSLASLLQPISFFGVVGFTLAFFISRYNFSDLILALRCAFHDHSLREDRQKARELFQNLGKYFFVSGVFCCMIGILYLLYNMGESEKLGSGIATGIVAIFYAVCSKLLIALPLENLCNEQYTFENKKKFSTVLLPLFLSGIALVSTIVLVSNLLNAKLFNSVFANLLVVSAPGLLYYLRKDTIQDKQKIEHLMQAILLGSILAFIISIIHTFGNLSDESKWHGVAVSFTGPFYAFLILGVLTGIKNRMGVKKIDLTQDLVLGYVSVLFLSVIFVGVLFALGHHQPEKVTNTSTEIINKAVESSESSL